MLRMLTRTFRCNRVVRTIHPNVLFKFTVFSAFQFSLFRLFEIHHCCGVCCTFCHDMLLVVLAIALNQVRSFIETFMLRTIFTV